MYSEMLVIFHPNGYVGSSWHKACRYKRPKGELDFLAMNSKKHMILARESSKKDTIESHKYSFLHGHELLSLGQHTVHHASLRLIQTNAEHYHRCSQVYNVHPVKSLLLS